MPTRTYAPSPRLAGRVAAIFVTESDAGEVPVLPVPGAVLGVQFRGSVVAEQGPLSPAGVTGIQSRMRRYTHPAATGSLLVRFTAQGAACLGVPAQHLLDQSVSLEDLFGRGPSADLCERLCAAADDRARVYVIEQFLANLPFASDALVARAAGLLTQERAVSVAQAATQLAVSERQLERRFQTRVGVSPKQFARLARFERAALAANSAVAANSATAVNSAVAADTTLPKATPTANQRPANQLTLAAIAQLAGYYDQSHFVREARRFAGVTPSELFFRPR